MKKLFVGNLPYTVDGEKLKEVFGAFGEVSEALVISDRHSGRSKGFGFVTFSQDAEADAAVEQMNGKEIEGRAVTVNIARPMEARR